MKTSKIGELVFGKFETEFQATPNVKTRLDKEKVSTSILIPSAFFWYDSELFSLIDENGDGKPDDKFGKKFKVIYYLDASETREFEKEALSLAQTEIKNIKIKYAIFQEENA